MFSIEYRNHVHDYVLRLASSDVRVVAGAIVGSLALNEGDRWSDLDLTFAIADNHSIFNILEDWTLNLVNELGAVHLFDLPSGASIYRVFLLPDFLQFDLSFTPMSQFGAIGPKFKLLFGSAVEKPYYQSQPVQEMFGYAVHHLLRARFCIERGRYWQAEYWISGARDYALSIICCRRGLPVYHGRGYDDLPTEVSDVFKESLVKSLTREDLLCALGCVVDGLLRDISDIEGLANKVKPSLLELGIEWNE